MNELDIIKYKWLAKADAYSELYDELKGGEYTDVEIRIMLLAKAKVLMQMIAETK
jgi:hypothetical protein